MIGEFVGQLLHAVTVAHVFHLQSQSYSQHMALGSFYGDLEGAVDSLAECYQGAYGIIDGYPTTLELPEGDPTKWLDGLSQFVQEKRTGLSDDSELQNLIDEIQGIIDRTLYKLRFLK
jgi:hypothetical protein